MKIFAFTKIGMVRIIAVSLMLSVYIIAIILNFASSAYTAGNFFATAAFCSALTAFSTFAKLKNHPPLLFGARGWLAASAVTFVFAMIFSATDAQFSGLFGEMIGYAVMLLTSPYFGLFYLIDIDWIYADHFLGFVGIIISVLICFIPEWVQKAADRRKLIKKYR